jgi:protein-S-isoprenylcysteine O-methyltransferase Ste14
VRLPEPATRAAAWAGAALFALSITCFLYTYAVTFAAQQNGRLSSLDVTVNVLLFAAFAFHHSVFARLPVRAWVARTVPPHYERTLYVAIASALLIAVCLAWRVLPGTLWNLTGNSRWLMHGLQAGGVVLTVWSARALGLRTLAGLPPETASAREADLSTSGPYRFVRHPIYAGWLLITFAMPLMTMTRFVFAVLAAVYLVAAIPLEERSLRRTSPDRFRRYASRVRWRLVPGVY